MDDKGLIKSSLRDKPWAEVGKKAGLSVSLCGALEVGGRGLSVSLAEAGGLR